MPEPFELPNTLVPDADVAKKIVDNACRAHFDYHKLIDNHQEHLDGKPPFDPKELRSKGQAWRRNRPHLKAKSKVDKVATDRVSQAMGALTNASVTFNRYDEEEHGNEENKQWLRDKHQRIRYGSGIAQAYIETLERDKRFVDYITRISYSASTWGIGYVVKEPGTSVDWLGSAYDIRNVKLPKRSQPDRIEKFIVFDEQTPLFFYQKWLGLTEGDMWIREGLEELLEALYNRTQKDDSQTTEDWITIAPSFSKCLPNIMESQYGEVKFAKIFNEEPNGDLTISYVAYNGDLTGKEVALLPMPKHLLYQKTWSNVKLSDTLLYVRDSAITSSGSLQDLRGLAQFAVPDSHDFDVRMNALKDKEMTFGNVQLLATTANQHQKQEFAVSSLFTVFPVGWAPTPDQNRADLGPLIQGAAAEEAAYQREIQGFDVDASSRIGNRATRPEVEVVTREANSAKRAKQLVQNNDWIRLHESNLVDLISGEFDADDDIGKEGRDWFFSELEFLWDKTPDEVVAIVEEFRNFELDFAIDDVPTLEKSLDFIDDDRFRRDTKRQLMYALGHPRRSIEAAIPRAEDGGITTDQHQLAEVQNAVFWHRGDLMISSSNQIDTHLDVHYRLFQQVVDSITNGADPAAAATYLQNGVDHTAKLLIIAEKDKMFRDRIEGWQLQQTRFEQALPEIQRIAVEQAQELADQQQQAQQQPLDPQTAADIQRKNVESAAKMQRTEENQQFTRQQKEERAQFDQSLKEQKAAADIALAQQKAAAESQIQ